jgi:hypothetical protein
MLRVKPVPKFVYRQFHDKPLDFYRRVRRPPSNALPQNFDQTWTHQNRTTLERFKWLLHSYWAVLSLAMASTGDCFEYSAPAGDNLEGHILLIANR